ncbi:hypothetical protein [Hydrococcus rivularis]|nr:hypothetical protein [Hydrococcus rivularis]
MKQQKFSAWGWCQIALIACTSAIIALTAQIARAENLKISHLLRI